MTPERKRQEDAEAREYAWWIKVGLPASEWRQINEDIIRRWSRTALLRIKTAAWKIIEDAAPDDREGR